MDWQPKKGDRVRHKADGWECVVAKVLPAVNELGPVAIFVEGGFWRVSQLEPVSNRTTG